MNTMKSNLWYRLPYKDDTDDNVYTVNPEEEKDLEEEIETDEELA